MQTSTSSIDDAKRRDFDAVEKGVYQKIARRLMPFLFLCYVVNFLDRVNIGFAQLQLRTDLGFSAEIYGLGAGLFYIGYVIFEVPSNMLLEKIGARKTLLRIMALWGAISMGTAFVTSPTQFYIMRFLLGVAEAGFFPGIILYLTYWIPGTRRAKFTALFLMSAPFSGIIGGPISGWIMRNTVDMAGLHGWQWLLIIEGFPAVILGIIAYFYLDDSPKDAKWLNADEKAIVIQQTMEQAGKTKKGHNNVAGLISAFKDPRVWVVSLVYFAVISGTGAISFWLPTIIRGLGIKDILHVGLLSAIPFIAGITGQLTFARNSDRTKERRLHVVVACAIAAIGWFILAMSLHNPALSIVVLSCAAVGIFASMAIFWTIPPAYLSGSAAATGIALISSIGGIGGFVTNAVVGKLITTTGLLSSGLFYMAALHAVGALLLLFGLPKKAMAGKF